MTTHPLMNRAAQRQKYLLFLPVIMVPFLCVIFYLLGGGKTTVQKSVTATGLNASLPAAKVPDVNGDKMSFYAVAEADSAKRLEQIKLDPYRKETAEEEIETEMPVVVTRKMAAVRKQVYTGSVVKETDETPYMASYRESKPASEPVVVPDPEMEAINATLDKIREIQNPQKKAAVGSANVASMALAVEAGENQGEYYFGKRKGKNQAFIGEPSATTKQGNALTAVIASNQVLQNGSTAKLELSGPVSIGGIAIPVGTNLYGLVQINGERLRIHISSLRIHNQLLPVSLEVYDMDGLEGIYAPGSLSREVAKESAENVIQSSGITGFDMSLKTQIMNSGVNAAKSLLTKKVKQVRVSLTAGYRVLLRDTKPNNQ